MVYVLLSEDPESGHVYLKRDIEVLMNNCRAVTDKFEVEYVSPYLNQKRFNQLKEKYKLTDVEGLVLVYDADGKELTEFVTVQDMAGPAAAFGDQERTEFQGEHALFTKLNFLLEGKSKPVVYFTQGSGEPELAEAFGAPKRRGEFRLSIIKAALEDANYEVKELRLSDPSVTKVPEDASVVLIIRPTIPFTDSALRVLHDYMEPSGGGDKKKGKLMVMLGADITSDGTMRQTGMEKLLTDFNVRLGNDRILTTELLPVPGGFAKAPTWIRVRASDKGATSLARTFAAGEMGRGGWEGYMPDPRTVEAAQPPASPHGGPSPSKYRVEPFLVCRSPGAWAETNLRADPEALADDFRGAGAAKLREKQKGDLLVAVTVTESAELGGEGTPRLVVFGSSDWVSNNWLGLWRTPFGPLFGSSLEWLRERKGIGTRKDVKELTTFAVDGAKETNAHLGAVLGLMMFGILGLGGGIWLIRRR
jgi:hypothetical protein